MLLVYASLPRGGEVGVMDDYEEFSDHMGRERSGDLSVHTLSALSPRADGPQGCGEVGTMSNRVKAPDRSLAGGEGDAGIGDSLNSLAQEKRQQLFDSRLARLQGAHSKLKSEFEIREQERLAQLIPLLASGLEIGQCAEKLGVTRGTLSRLMSRHNVRKASYVPTDQLIEQTRLIIEGFNQGLTSAQMRDKFKISLGAIAGVLHRQKAKGVISNQFFQERDDVLREWYPVSSLQEVTDRCNALDGQTVSVSQVRARAHILKLKGPPVPKKEKIILPKKIKEASTPPRKNAPKPKYRERVWKEARQDPPPDDWMIGGARIPVGRKWEEIKELAARDGYFLASRFDLVGYNKGRMRRGMAPYAISNLRRDW